MEYLKSEKEYIIRLDKGESVVNTLKTLLSKEEIKLGYFTGLGATNDVTIGILNTKTKEIVKKKFTGDFEIGTMFGTVTQKDGEPYIHAHITVGNVGLDLTYAGHLVDAMISATAEIVLKKMEGTVGRRFDEAVGLDLMEFKEE